MSTETPTPETDDIKSILVRANTTGTTWRDCFFDLYNFARRLEKQRDLAIKERDEARAEAAELRERVERLSSIIQTARNAFELSEAPFYDGMKLLKALAETDPKGEA